MPNAPNKDPDQVPDSGTVVMVPPELPTPQDDIEAGRLPNMPPEAWKVWHDRDMKKVLRDKLREMGIAPEDEE